jgi:cytochrome c oxidase assembly protein subunit 15
MAHAIHARRTVRGAPLAGALTLAAAVTLQVALGITALLYQAPLALALLHQATGIVVLTVAVVHAEQLSVRTATARVPARAALSSS